MLSLQNELTTLRNKRKETEVKLRDLGKEVKELEPKHAELKKSRDEKKKQWRAVTVIFRMSHLHNLLISFKEFPFDILKLVVQGFLFKKINKRHPTTKWASMGANF